MSWLDHPLTLTPQQFELEVKNLIEKSGLGLSQFNVQRLEKLKGTDGEYEIDVTARFRALDSDFIVLIECKHHRHPIKRDTVQVLYDRIRAVGAHKGMIFSTATFQSGAIEYARAHGTALVQIADGRTSFASRGYADSKPQISNLLSVPEFVGWAIDIKNGKETYRLIYRPEPKSLFPSLWTKQSDEGRSTNETSLEDP